MPGALGDVVVCPEVVGEDRREPLVHGCCTCSETSTARRWKPASACTHEHHPLDGRSPRHQGAAGSWGRARAPSPRAPSSTTPSRCTARVATS